MEINDCDIYVDSPNILYNTFNEHNNNKLIKLNQ